MISGRLGVSDDGDDEAGADRLVALTQREANALIERDRAIEGEAHACARTRHDETVRSLDVERAGDVRPAEEELRAVTGRERGVPSALSRQIGRASCRE